MPPQKHQCDPSASGPDEHIPKHSDAEMNLESERLLVGLGGQEGQEGPGGPRAPTAAIAKAGSRVRLGVVRHLQARGLRMLGAQSAGALGQDRSAAVGPGWICYRAVRLRPAAAPRSRAAYGREREADDIKGVLSAASIGPVLLARPIALRLDTIGLNEFRLDTVVLVAVELVLIAPWVNEVEGPAQVEVDDVIYVERLTRWTSNLAGEGAGKGDEAVSV